MNVADLVKLIGNAKGCQIFPPIGLPIAEQDLPKDIIDFYQACNGLTLFENAKYSLTISTVERFTLANPEIVGELCPEDISSRWYIIGRSDSGQAVTIDLDPKRLGRCYDSYWDRHGVKGSCPVIANTFTEFLQFMFLNNGKYWYWLGSNFHSLGDAYD